MSVIVKGAGGGLNIANGEIKEYPVSEAVSKNTFVNIVGQYIGDPYDNLVSAGYNITSKIYMTMCELGNNKGIVFFGDSSAYCLRAQVFNINDVDDVSFGTITTVCTDMYCYIRPRAFRINDNTVLLMHNGTDNKPGYYLLLHIDGYSITIGNSGTIGTFYNNSMYCMTEISTNKFVICGDIDGRKLAGVVFTYDENNQTITSGTVTTLNSSTYSGEYYGENKANLIEKLADNTILVGCHPGSTGWSIKKYTISDYSFDSGTTCTITNNTEKTIGSFAGFKLIGNTLYVIDTVNSGVTASYNPLLFICTLEDTTITINICRSLAVGSISSAYNKFKFLAQAIDGDGLIMFYEGVAENAIYGFESDGSNVATPISLGTLNIADACMLEKYGVLYTTDSTNTNYNLFVFECSWAYKIKGYTSKNRLTGISKGNYAVGDTGKVMVPAI